MQKLLYTFVAIIILAACVGNGKEHAKLDVAQSIINEHPDSALAILDSLETSSQSFSQSSLRRWQLLRLMAQNKCDTVFHSDSLQLILTDYFDHHGTPNEKMWVHYLLGRAHYDMGEPLSALSDYDQAALCADTSSTDCDFNNLYRIYLNKSLLLYYQNMPREILCALDEARQAAIKAHDTLATIQCFVKKAMAYERLEKTDSMAAVGFVASCMYRDYGRDDMAAMALAWVIPFNVENGDYPLAARNIKEYESNSGLFDENNEILRGKEHYYYVKGRYYLGIGEIDTAESLFRKCMQAANLEETEKVGKENYNCMHAACKGLYEMYKNIGNPDSMAKYASLSEEYNDSLHARSYFENAQQLERMYDFNRKEKRARKTEIDNLKMKSHLKSVLLCLTFIMISGSIAIFLLRKALRLKQEELKSNDMKQKVTLEEKDQQLKQLNDEIRQLNDKMEEKVESDSLKETNQKLFNTEIYKEILEILKQTKNVISAEQWKTLERMYSREHPKYYAFVNSAEKLSAIDRRMCWLIRLGLKPKDISAIMGMDKSNVSNARSRIYKKLFGEEGTGKDLDSRLLGI